MYKTQTIQNTKHKQRKQDSNLRPPDYCTSATQTELSSPMVGGLNTFNSLHAL